MELFTPENLDAFALIREMIATGTRWGNECERTLYRTFHWVTPSMAARLVTLYVKNREKIESELKARGRYTYKDNETRSIYSDEHYGSDCATCEAAS